MGQLILSGAIDRPRTIPPEELKSLAGAGDAADEVPVTLVAALAEPRPEAAFCSVVSSDEDYTASIPVDDLLAGGVLLLEAAGPAPTRGEGRPIRLVVREGKTLCWNVKDVGELRFTTSKEPDSLPERLTH